MSSKDFVQIQTQGKNQENQQMQNEGETQILEQPVQIVKADQNEENMKQINNDMIDLNKQIGQYKIQQQTHYINPEVANDENADKQQECKENNFVKPIQNIMDNDQDEQKQIDQYQESQQGKINLQSEQLKKQKQLQKNISLQTITPELLQQNDDLEKLRQTVARSKHGLSSESEQSKTMTHEDLMNTVKRKEIKKEIVKDCEESLLFLQQHPNEESKFCFKENKFRVKRLKQGNDDLTVTMFLSGLKELGVVGTGNMSEGCTQYHDQVGINFGGEYVFKEMAFAQPIDQYNAYKELSILNLINEIPNGENYFAQLHCCFITRKDVSQGFKIVFVMEFGRNSLGQMFKFKRGYSEYELITLMKHLLEAGGLLEQYQIAQNDTKPDNIILNRHFRNVKIIDFGTAIRISKTKNPDLKKKLKWRGGSPAYASPQMQAAYLQFQKDKQNQHNKHCLQYLSPPRYSPFKSDVYSVAVTICQMAGIKSFIWCFMNRSEVDKQQFLESHFKCKELAYILYNLLLNNEDQRWSFEQALLETNKAITAINQNSIVTLIQPNLIEETEKSFLKVAKLAFKDEQELKRSNEDNFGHFHKMIVDNYNAGASDDALFYAEKSLIYAHGYPPQSDKDKLYALLDKGQCLDDLKRFKEAALVCQQAFDHLQSIKGQFDNNENDYQLDIGYCLYQLGIANKRLKKEEEALRNCDDALTALRLNDQQSRPPNEQQISGIYNLQASIYSLQQNFAAAKLKYQQSLQIAFKNNIIIEQAACYKNMCTLKMRQNEFDKEALHCINNAIQFFTEHFNGQNNKDVLDALFNKCIVQCFIESNDIYEQTLNLAFKIAMSVIGAGKINKQYADYIELQGQDCITQKYATAMKMQPAFKNHAIRLFKEAEYAYQLIGDKENEIQMQYKQQLCSFSLKFDSSKKEFLCPNQHILEQRGSQNMNLQCDVCKYGICGQNFEVTSRCNQCDYDACTNCTFIGYSQDCFRCFTTPLKTLFALQQYKCGRCKQDFNNTVTNRCHPCNFDLCNACFKQQCPQKHPWQLQCFQVDSTIVNCLFCKKSINDHDVFRCEYCNTNLCLFCFYCCEGCDPSEQLLRPQIQKQICQKKTEQIRLAEFPEYAADNHNI